MVETNFVAQEVTMDALPNEVLLEILCHVPARSLIKAAQVCTDWWSLIP